MARDKMLMIRLSERERADLDRLARLEKLPPSTLARRILLQMTDAVKSVPGEERPPAGGGYGQA